MGLIKKKEFETGLVAERAYFNIDNVSGDKDQLFVIVAAYASQSAHASGKPAVEKTQFQFVPADDEDAVRWDRQAYAFIKSLPDFKDAIDILEDERYQQ